MKKNGFTLVEIIIVIALAGLLFAIAVPSALKFAQKNKEKLKETRITLIESAATKFGKDNTNLLIDSCYYLPNGVNDADAECTIINLNLLYTNNYITSNDLVDPTDNTNFTGVIEIQYYYNRYYSSFVNSDSISSVYQITNKVFKINNGATTTTSTNVSLNLSATNATQYCISTSMSCQTSWLSFNGNITTNYTLSGGNGQKTLYALLKNSKNSDYITSSITLSVTIPTIAISTATVTDVKSLSNTINISASSYASTNSYQYYLSSNSNSLIGGSWINYTRGTSFTIGTGQTGIYYLFVKRVTDNDGNLSIGGIITNISGVNYHCFGSYTFDNTSPIIAVSPSSVAVSKSVSITISASEPNLATSNSYQYYLSSSQTALANGIWTSYTLGSTAFTIGTGLTGTYYLYIKEFADKTGNLSVGGTFINISGATYRQFGPYIFDNTGPIITLSPVSVSSTKSSSFTIKYSGSNLSSSNSYQYYLSSSSSAFTGGAWTNYTSNSSYSIGNGLTGTYYLFVKKITNTLGTSSTASGSSTVTVSTVNYHRFGPYVFDNMAPVIASYNVSNYVTNGSYADITLTTSSTDVAYMCLIASTSSSSCSWQSYTTSSTMRYYFVNGTNVVYGYLKDAAGNVSAYKSGTFVYSTSITPTFTAFSIDRTIEQYYFTPVTLYITATNATSMCFLANISSVSSCSWVPYASTYSYPMATLYKNSTVSMFAWVKSSTGNVSSVRSLAVFICPGTITSQCYG